MSSNSTVVQLKSAHLRQYLHEGPEGWYMPSVAEAVPDLLHISQFLFFAGLGDSLLIVDTTVGLSIAVPIGIGGLRTHTEEDATSDKQALICAQKVDNIHKRYSP